MMLEKVKTAILIALILLSLVLTFFLWYGTTPHEDTEIVFQESFFFEEPREQISTVIPTKIVLPLNDEEFNIWLRGSDIYNEIWEKTGKLFMGGFYNVIADNNSPEKDDASLILYFDPGFPVQAVEMLPESVIPDVRQMHIYLQDSEASAFLKGEEDGVLIKFNDILMAEDIEKKLNEVLNYNTLTYCRLKEADTEEEAEESGEETEEEEEADTNLADFNYSVASDIYLPVDDLYINTGLKFFKEEIPTSDLLKAVFINEKLARRIEGPDGTLIFTDGEKGLRISESVEFTAPRLEKGAASFSYLSAIKKANEYICYYGGWSENLYLKDIHLYNSAENGNSYYARWNYYHEGFPVRGNSVETIVKFNDRGLYHYNRSLLVPSGKSEDNVKLTPGEEALKRGFEIYVEDKGLNNDEEIVLNVNNAYIAYYIDVFSEVEEARANPVWVIEINEEIIYLDVSDLTPVMPGESDEYL